jgi:hypothetical protein
LVNGSTQTDGLDGRGRQPVTDLGDRLDLERADADAGGETPQPTHHPVQRVLAHQHAGPTGVQEFVARQNAAFGPQQGDEHLHHARLEKFLATVVVRHAARGGIDEERAKPNRLLVRQTSPLASRLRDRPAVVGPPCVKIGHRKIPGGFNPHRR